MISLRTAMLPIVSLAVALAAGCGGTETVDSTAANVAAQSSHLDTAAAQNAGNARGPEGHRDHRGGPGADFLLHAALRAPINLTAEQKTKIEQALAAAHPAPKPEAGRPEDKADDKARSAQLATAVRSGSFDAKQFANIRPEPSPAMIAARTETSAKALATLHATLTKEQRVALVDSIQKRAAEHEGREDEERKARGEHAKHGFGESPLAHGLDLTDAQRQALRAKLEGKRPSAADITAMKAKMEAGRAAMKAKLATFADDDFDAKQFATLSARPTNEFEKGDHRAQELSALTSVLTPAQREKLAARIEQGPARQ